MNKKTSFALPETMHAYIDERVRLGSHGNTGEYLRNLIRRDEEDLAKKCLRELMEEGLNSGPGREMTPADWAGLRKAALGCKG